jgi:hypothetical protein
MASIGSTDRADARRFGMNKRIGRILMVGALALGVLGAAVPASAKDGDVIARRDCSKTSDVKLRARIDDGRVKVEYEVHSGVVGQTWNMKLTQDGVTKFNGTRVTNAGGEAIVKFSKANGSDTDRYVATASNSKTGETCGAVSVTI